MFVDSESEDEEELFENSPDASPQRNSPTLSKSKSLPGSNESQNSLFASLDDPDQISKDLEDPEDADSSKAISHHDQEKEEEEQKSQKRGSESPEAPRKKLKVNSSSDEINQIQDEIPEPEVPEERLTSPIEDDQDPNISNVEEFREHLVRINGHSFERTVGALIDGSKYIRETSNGISTRNFLQNEILPKTCFSLLQLDQDGFNRLQKFLIRFLFDRWTEINWEGTRPPFEILEFIALILAFIAKVGPKEIGEEYIEIFSHHTNPPHILLFIFPSVLCASKKDFSGTSNDTETFKNESELFARFFGPLGRSLKRGSSLIKSDWEFIQILWTRLDENWPKNPAALKEFPQKILHLTWQSAFILIKCNDKQVLISVLRVLINRFLATPLLPELIVSVGIMIRMFQAKAPGSGVVELIWKNLSTLLSRTFESLMILMSARPLLPHCRVSANYAFSALNEFLKRAQVPNKNIFALLATILQDNDPRKSTAHPSGGRLNNSNKGEKLEKNVASLEKICDKIRVSRRADFSDDLKYRVDECVRILQNFI